MKKFLLICAILFIGGVGCKKMDMDGGGLCASSPVSGPPLILVIQNAAGKDLLDEKTDGAYSKDKITLFRKGVDGQNIPVNFSIRPPFSYANEMFDFNHLQIDISSLKGMQEVALYLQLGSAAPYQLDLTLNKDRDQVERLFINHKEAQRDQSGLGKDVPVYHLSLN